jgi:hypothetical protein
VNETCGENQACDTTPGFDQGTCKERIPNCIGTGEGHLFCDELSLMACGLDEVTAIVTEVCTGACEEAACDNFRDACPADFYVNCASDCHGRDADCPASCGGAVYSFDWSADSIVVRLGPAADTCLSECGSERVGRWIRPDIGLPADSRIKVTVGPPWRIQAATSMTNDVCQQDWDEGCLMVEPVTTGVRFIYVFADDLSASERNVTITAVGENEQCL